MSNYVYIYYESIMSIKIHSYLSESSNKYNMSHTDLYKTVRSSSDWIVELGLDFWGCRLATMAGFSLWTLPTLDLLNVKCPVLPGGSYSHRCTPHVHIQSPLCSRQMKTNSKHLFMIIAEQRSDKMSLWKELDYCLIRMNFILLHSFRQREVIRLN